MAEELSTNVTPPPGLVYQQDSEGVRSRVGTRTTTFEDFLLELGKAVYAVRELGAPHLANPQAQPHGTNPILMGGHLTPIEAAAMQLTGNSYTNQDEAAAALGLHAFLAMKIEKACTYMHTEGELAAMRQQILQVCGLQEQ